MKELYRLINTDDIDILQYKTGMKCDFIDHLRKIKFFDNIENIKTFEKMHLVVDVPFKRGYYYRVYLEKNISKEFCIRQFFGKGYYYKEVKKILMTYTLSYNFIDRIYDRSRRPLDTELFNIACLKNQYKFVKLLLSLGCPSTTQSQSETSLSHLRKVNITHYGFRHVCRNKNYKIFKLLVSIGRSAKISKKYDRYGPIDIYENYHYPEGWQMNRDEMLKRYHREENN